MPNGPPPPWFTNGNAGTDSTRDFLGTQDFQPLVIKTNGVEAMRIIGAATEPLVFPGAVSFSIVNVGIGTTNPAGPLHILGPESEPPAGLPAEQNGLLLGLQSTAGYKWIQSYGGSLALNPQGNNVGIGTISPGYKLQVSASDQLGIMVQGPGSGVGAGIQLDATGTRNWEILATGQTSAQGPGKLNIRNLGNAQDVFTITDSGNVGIGTTQPGAKVHIGSDGAGFGVAVRGAAMGVYAENTGPNFATGFFTNLNAANSVPTLFAHSAGANNAFQASASGNGGWAGRFDAVPGSNGVYISSPPNTIGLMVTGGGSKSAVVATSQGARALYTEESTEIWFTDYGFGRLQNGRTVIQIDPLFAETVNLNEPYHVFTQPYGNATLYVSQRTRSTFEICLNEGDPNVEFSYRLVAKRRQSERMRLERAPSADNDPNLYPEKRPEWEAQRRLYRPT